MSQVRRQNSEIVMIKLTRYPLARQSITNGPNSFANFERPYVPRAQAPSNYVPGPQERPYVPKGWDTQQSTVNINGLDSSERPYAPKEQVPSNCVSKPGERPYVPKGHTQQSTVNGNDSSERPYVRKVQAPSTYVPKSGERPYVPRDQRRPYGPAAQAPSTAHGRHSSERPYVPKEQAPSTYVPKPGERPYAPRDQNRPYVPTAQAPPNHVPESQERSYYNEFRAQRVTLPLIESLAAPPAPAIAYQTLNLLLADLNRLLCTPHAGQAFEFRGTCAVVGVASRGHTARVIDVGWQILEETVLTFNVNALQFKSLTPQGALATTESAAIWMGDIANVKVPPPCDRCEHSLTISVGQTARPRVRGEGTMIVLTHRPYAA
ncbi:hypothetical protein DFH06DRAFT_1318971 [Mycena polygramma]|nr:hypothetical protein DFH06DRAFT_1318971 [Mycena polygramma]